MTRRPTLETVAARAGVSRSLVSLVLNGSPKVGAERRRAVLDAMAELGYRPNSAARRLAENRSRSVGVLLNDIRQPWFAEMLEGVTPVLHAGGLHMLLGDGRLDRGMDETLTWSFLELGVDGLLLAGSVPGSAALAEVASRLPTVAVGGRDLDLPHVDVVSADDLVGAELAVRHLAERGHTRIAHVAGLPGRVGELRREGYERAMTARGLTPVVGNGGMTDDGGYDAGRHLLTAGDRPTAVFAANDLSGVGVLSAAADLGLRVPEDVAVVGFDDSALARLGALSLTSVDGHARAMGRRAAETLLERIADPDGPARTELLEPTLEVRRSSGPAAGPS